MSKINDNKCNVYLINTGMDKEGKRYPLDFTRNCVKGAIRRSTHDDSENVLNILESLIND